MDKFDNLVVCQICGTVKEGGYDCPSCIGEFEDTTFNDDQPVGIYEEDSMYDDVLY